MGTRTNETDLHAPSTVVIQPSTVVAQVGINIYLSDLVTRMPVVLLRQCDRHVPVVLLRQCDRLKQ